MKKRKIEKTSNNGESKEERRARKAAKKAKKCKTQETREERRARKKVKKAKATLPETPTFSNPSIYGGSFLKPVQMQDCKDYSIPISDQDLLAACQFRTCRKGARGEQKGKLARVDSKLIPDSMQ